MNNRILITLAFLLSFIGSITTLLAQDNASREVIVRVACIGFSKDLHELSSADGKVVVPLSIRYPSKPLKLRVIGKKLRLYDPANLPTEDKPAQPAATVELPSTGKKFIVLLLPNKKNKIAYDGVAIVQSDFHYGGICIYNATHVPIMMTVDKKKQPVIQPAQPSIVNFNLNGKNRVAEVQFWAPKMKKFFYSAKWNFRPDIREIHMLYIHPRTKRPAIKTLVDVKPAVPAGTP